MNVIGWHPDVHFTDWAEICPTLEEVLERSDYVSMHMPLVPETTGFDAQGHLDYIRYVLEQSAIPVANEGWQMYQPPLFYVLCAGVTKLDLTTIGRGAWQRPDQRTWLRNHRYTTSQQIAAMMLAYREEYRPAMGQLDELLAVAPANNELRLSKAQVNRWRGWHDAAADELAKLRSPEPITGALVNRTHLLLDTQDWARAERSLAEIKGLAVKDKSVVDLSRRLLVPFRLLHPLARTHLLGPVC